MVRLAALLALLAGCATPYQRMGFSGGVTDRPMGEGRFFVEVRVNGYTSSGTALQYLHRRSQELCVGAGYASYVFDDSAADATYGAVRIGDTVTTYSKPEMSAIVRCTGQNPPTPTFDPADPPPPAVAATASGGEVLRPEGETSADGPWWCAAHDQQDLGLCLRARSLCESFREQMQASGTTYAECTSSRQALCFRSRANGDEQASCHPTWTSCVAGRAYATSQGREILTDCAETQ